MVNTILSGTHANEKERDELVFQGLVSQLENRCSKINLKTRRDTGAHTDFSFSFDIYLPAGRGTKFVTAWDISDAEDLSAFDFENYVFIDGLNAICSYKQNIIYAALVEIAPITNRAGPFFPRPKYDRVFAQLKGKDPDKEKDDGEPILMEGQANLFGRRLLLGLAFPGARVAIGKAKLHLQIR